MYTSFARGAIQIAPQAHIQNFSEDFIAWRWWRCRKCGHAIGETNLKTGAEQTTCYLCNFSMPESFRVKDSPSTTTSTTKKPQYKLHGNLALNVCSKTFC